MHRLLSVSLLVLLALVWPSVARAETPDEYRAALADTVQAADAAVAALPDGVPLSDHPPLVAAAQRLLAIRWVTLADGSIVVVDNSILLRRLQGNRGEGQRASESLRQLLNAVDEANAKTAWVSKDEARAALDAVLASPELRGAAGQNLSEMLQSLRERLFRWLESLFPWFKIPQLPSFDLSKPASVVYWLVTAALIVFAAGFIGFVWRQARRNVMRSAALPDEKMFVPDDARAARLAALRAADNGDFRLAVHYLLLWAILHLAERARLRYDRSLTNREQMRVLASDGEVRDLLHTMVDAFDRIWYGHAPCDAGEYGQLRAVVERIVEVAT
jgi:hypothetical protein